MLYGSYARGRAQRAATTQEREEADLLPEVVRVGWGRGDPAFRRLFTSRAFVPAGSPEQMGWFDEFSGPLSHPT